MLHQDHPFHRSPNRTILKLAIPVLFSLVAEPVTGLADTAFVARLGSEAAAALGIGTMAFSAVFWAFSFLGIGTQTEVALSLGEDDPSRAARISSLACAMAVAVGLLLFFGALPLLDGIGALLGGEGPVLQNASEYMEYRLLGAPGVLVTVACFGALRGAQDMKTALYVAVGVNAMNVLLDWVLVFGVGPFPAMGVGGAGLASSISQWCGAIWALVATGRMVGLSRDFRLADCRKLLSIGGDIFVRTGAVLVFLSLCTRAANQVGPEEGAAYQAIRQFFIFAALFLDAFAITAQSLVGYFVGRSDRDTARSVARLTCFWSIGTGAALCLGMILFRAQVAWLLVPAGAVAVFHPGWLTAALMQPLSSLSYATDGIHWGTGDFRFLRNAMVIASLCGVAAVIGIEQVRPEPALVWIWLAATLWTSIRAGFGIARIWPGIGDAPLNRRGAI